MTKERKKKKLKEMNKERKNKRMWDKKKKTLLEKKDVNKQRMKNPMRRS